MLIVQGPEKVLDVCLGRVRRVLVDWPGEIDLLLTNLVLDKNLATLVRDRNLLHDVHYVTLDWYLGVRQVDSVELLQDFLETVHKGKVRQYAYCFLCVDIVNVDIV